MCHEQGSSPSGSLLRKAAFLKSLIEVNALLSLRGGRATISLERKERGEKKRKRRFVLFLRHGKVFVLV